MVHSTRPLISIDLPGPPRGKGRPRSSHWGGVFRTHTDRKTLEYEDRLRLIGSAQMAGGAPLDYPLFVQVEALCPIPASWSAKKRGLAASGGLVPTGKPDADNIAKGGADALNGVVWRDDSLIVSLLVIKRYSLTPSLRISVWKWFE